MPFECVRTVCEQMKEVSFISALLQSCAADHGRCIATFAEVSKQFEDDCKPCDLVS